MIRRDGVLPNTHAECVSTCPVRPLNRATPLARHPVLNFRPQPSDVRSHSFTVTVFYAACHRLLALLNHRHEPKGPPPMVMPHGSQEEFIEARLVHAAERLEEAKIATQAMGAFPWKSGFTAPALSTARAVGAAVEALVNLYDLARKEGADVHAELVAQGETEAADLVDIMLTRVTGRCTDPDCATEHQH